MPETGIRPRVGTWHGERPQAFRPRHNDIGAFEEAVLQVFQEKDHRKLDEM